MTIHSEMSSNLVSIWRDWEIIYRKLSLNLAKISPNPVTNGISKQRNSKINLLPKLVPIKYKAIIWIGKLIHLVKITSHRQRLLNSSHPVLTLVHLMLLKLNNKHGNSLFPHPPNNNLPNKQNLKLRDLVILVTRNL